MPVKCMVQEVANAGQVPGTRSGKCRSSAWYKKQQMPDKCLEQEVANAGNSLALLVNPDIDIACRVRLNSTAAHCAPEPSFGRVTSLLPTLRHQMEVSGERHFPAVLPSSENHLYTVDRILGGPQY
jgi:hypothetical protein